MFSTREFQDWAKENVVRFAAVMTRIEGREDDALLRTYGFRGFPSLALLDERGEATNKRIGRDLTAMRTAVDATLAYRDLKSKVDAGEDYDRGDWLLSRIGLGMLDLATATAEFEAHELEGAQRQAVIEQLVLLELPNLATQARAGGDEEKAAQARVLALFRDGRTPPSGANQQAQYDALLIAAAREAGDAEAIRYAFPRVRASLDERLASYQRYLEQDPKDPQRIERIGPMIERTEREIAELEAEAKTFADR